MNKVAGIYRITSPSGAIYVGQSWDIHRRWREYRSEKFLQCGKQPKLINSFRKYGVQSHTFQVVITARPSDTQEDMNGLERFVLDEYKIEFFRILNIREAGGNGRPSSDSIAKMVATRRANGSYVASPELREKFSRARQGRKGTPHTEETKRLLSEMSRGRKPSEAAKERNRQSQLGRKHSAETKAKIGDANRGRKRPDLAARNRSHSKAVAT